MKKSIIYSSTLLFFAGILFVFNDAIINYLSQTDIKFYHFIFYGIPIFLCFPIYLYFNGTLKKNLKCSNYFPPVFRGILNIPLPFIAFITLEQIKLPEFTILNMSAPLMGTIFAIFFLNEKLNFLTYASLLIGFLGVLFVVQPGFESFNIYYLIVLVGVFLITVTTFIVNKYSNVTTNVGYFLYGGIFAHLISIPFFIINPIKVTIIEYTLISSAALFINFAMFFTTTAFKLAQKHYASVFILVYLQVLWSSLVGIFIFNEYMNLYAYIGALFIVLSGIISLPSQIKQLKEAD